MKKKANKILLVLGVILSLVLLYVARYHIVYVVLLLILGILSL